MKRCVALVAFSAVLGCSEGKRENKLACGPGTLDEGGTCVIDPALCPNGTAYDQASGTCAVDPSLCPTGTTFDASSGTCKVDPAQCPNGTTHDQASDTCLAIIVDCAEGTTLDEATGSCDPNCAEGAHLEGGDCVPDISGCAAGTHQVAGECLPDIASCGTGTVFVGDACVPYDDTVAGLVTDDCLMDDGAELVPGGPCWMDDTDEAILDPQRFEPPAEASEQVILGGSIAAPADTNGDGIDEPDVDEWFFEVEAGDWWDVSADGVGGLHAGFVISGASPDGATDNRFFHRRGLSAAGDGAQRQIYFPVSGLYVMAISDTANFLSMAPRGGNGQEYLVTITDLGAPSPSTIPMPAHGEPATYSGDYSGLAFYRMDVDGAAHLTVEQTVVGFDDLTPATIIMQQGTMLLETVSSGLGLDWRQTRTEIGTADGAIHELLFVVDYAASLLPFAPDYVLTITGESLPMLTGEPLTYGPAIAQDEARHAVRQWSSYGFTGVAGDLAAIRVASNAPISSRFEVDPNESIAEADGNGFVLATNEGMAGEISTSGDEDYVAISIPEPGEHIIETAPVGGSTNPQVGDTTLTLFDSDGVQLAYNDDGGQSLYSRVSYTFPSAGIWYARVAGWSRQGEYLLLLATNSPLPSWSVAVSGQGNELLFLASQASPEATGVVLLPQSGQYFVRVKNEAAAIGEEYPVHITVTPTTPTHLGAVTADTPLALTDIAAGPETSWFSVDVAASDLFQVQMRGHGLSTSQVDLIAYHVDKTTLVNDNYVKGDYPDRIMAPFVLDEGAGDTELIELIAWAPTGGRHYLSLMVNDEAGATVELTVDAVTPVHLGAANAAPSRTGEVIDGTFIGRPFLLDVGTMEKLTIDLTPAADLNAAIEVWDLAARPSSTEDRGGDGEPEQMTTVTGEAQTMLVAVVSRTVFPDGTSSTFDLSVNGFSQSEVEPNDVCAQASPVFIDFWQSVAHGAIDQPGDVDTFSFSIAVPKYVQMETSAGQSPPLSRGDTYLALYDASGELVSEHEDIDPIGDPTWGEPPNRYSQLHAVLEPGTYCAVVRSSPTYAPEDVGTYALAMLQFPLEVEPNDEATPEGGMADLNPDGLMAEDLLLVQGRLSTPTDVDCYGFDLAPDAEAEIQAMGATGGIPADAFDAMRAELWHDGTSQTLTGGWDSYNDIYQWQTAPLSLEGLYFVCVHDDHGGQYDYVLRIFDSR